MSSDREAPAEAKAGYDFARIDKKWQKKWEDEKLFRTPEHPKDKYYLLVMFAYPSGDIHMGHFRNYILGDAVAHYQMMNGKDILHPFGWDAFGLPAEQAAIKGGKHPREWTLGNIAVSRATLKKVGISFDWDREVISCLPEFYRWNQWLFLKLFEKGMAFRKESLVNFCNTCNTVLANEQVEADGTCWRCHNKVGKKRLNQWYFRITEYAERLLQGLDRLDGWSDRVKTMQRNWIGKSVGCEITFKLENSTLEIPVFTTRPDTIFGVTFMAIAPEADLVAKLNIPPERKQVVDEYIAKSIAKSEIERQSETGEKDGVFTGLYATNPLNGEKAQLWIGDYVLASYGTGVVMGVPAHDTRDFVFARKYNIPIRVVIKPQGTATPDQNALTEAYTELGEMCNSGEFDGKVGEAAIEAVVRHVEAGKLGSKKINYKLRDWLISRQRYWGTPIPIVHCPKCGEVAVPYDQLPVELPTEGVDYIPKGRSPLEDVPEWVNVKCPRCGQPARRDADTMDTFVDSSWYLLRYADNKNDKAIYDIDKVNTWMPVDLYIGGIEHATGHLIYFRFMTKFLHDSGYCSADEPALRLFNHGMVMDAQGQIMSKSIGNVVSPIHLIETRGVDTCRLAMLFAAPSDREIPWSNEGLTGVERFLTKFGRIIEHVAAAGKSADLTKHYATGDLDPVKTEIYIHLNQTIKKVSDDLARMQFNTCIAAVMEFLGKFDPAHTNDTAFNHYVVSKLVQLIAPMAPHFAEEAWEALGSKTSVFKSAWPQYDHAAVQFNTVVIVVQVNGKVRAELEIERGTDEATVKELAITNDKVKKYVEGKQIAKLIYVKDKLVSIAVK
jgi:leucyl-tRNA synthetase